MIAPPPPDEALRAQADSPHSHPFPRGPAVPSSRLPSPAPRHLPCPGGGGRCPLCCQEKRRGLRRHRQGGREPGSSGWGRVGPLRGDPRGGAGGVRRGREGGTGAGEEELGTGLGDGQGRGAGPGPAAEGSGVSAGCQPGSVSPRPLPLSPGGRAAELARPGPAEGTRMRGAAQCGSMCALPHLKGNEPAALPSSLPHSHMFAASSASWAGIRRSTRGSARVRPVPCENRVAFFAPYVKTASYPDKEMCARCT